MRLRIIPEKGRGMKTTGKLSTTGFITVFSLAGALIFTGCEGSETKRAAEETVKELSGAELIDKGERLKGQIKDLNAEDVRRIQEDLSRGVYRDE